MIIMIIIIIKGAGGLGSWRTDRDYPTDSIAEDGQNTETRLKETCCHSNSSEKPSANTDVKNSKGVNNNNSNSYMFRYIYRTHFFLLTSSLA